MAGGLLTYSQFFIKLVTILAIWSFKISQGLQNQQVFMEGGSCGITITVGSATVTSHYRSDTSSFGQNVDCSLHFNASSPTWKIMIKFIYLDLRDMAFNEICNDGVYIYDSARVGSKAFKAAGTHTGLCGDDMPPTMTSTGPHVTIHFLTDNSRSEGRGFQLQITEFSEENSLLARDPSCSPNFYCSKAERCIRSDFVCDRINNCDDASDEEVNGVSQCNPTESDTWWSEFLDLGIAACIGIIVGGIVVIILLIVCVVCTCKRCGKQHSETSDYRQSIQNSNHGSVSGGATSQPAPQQVQYKDGITYHPVSQTYPINEYQTAPNQGQRGQGGPAYPSANMYQSHPGGSNYNGMQAHPQMQHGYNVPQAAPQHTVDGRPAIQMVPLGAMGHEQPHMTQPHMTQPHMTQPQPYNTNSPLHITRGESHSHSSGYSSQQGVQAGQPGGFQRMHTKPIMPSRGYTANTDSSQSSQSQSSHHQRDSYPRNTPHTQTVAL